MHCTCTRLLVHAAAGTALLAMPAAALAQDPGTPPPAGATPVEVSVSVPSSVKRAALTKGVPVKVTCAPGCSARISFTGPTGIITEKSLTVAAGGTGTAKVKATPSQARSLKKGAKLTVFVTARGDDGGRGTARKTLKVR